MVPGNNLTKSTESFWESILSDTQDAGVLGRNPKALDPQITTIAEVTVPLVAYEPVPSPIRTETLLRGAWAVVLSRHTGNNDVIFFSLIDGQEPWIAPIRTNVPSNRPASEWLIEFETVLQEVEQNSPIPKHLIVQTEEEGLNRVLSTFSVVPKDEEALPYRLQPKSPLHVIVQIETGVIQIQYNSALFEKAEAAALGHHLNLVLQGMTSTPQGIIGTLPLLTEQEQHQLLHEWNDTTVSFPTDKCIHEFFEEQVVRTPEAVAIVFHDREWTYRELNSQAEILAHRLRVIGVGPGAFVAICLDRSLELMAALLAVLKAGGAYVPLDPSYPAERLAFMIDDAKPAVIMVSQKTEGQFSPDESRLFRVENTSKEIASKDYIAPKSSDSAYVLYTSGSTGKPKGVIITHRNVANFFSAMDAVIGTEVGVWLAVTSVNFDISVFELFWTLARGFRVILQEEGQWASQAGSLYSLPQQIKRHGVTHLQCTPSLASMLVCDSESLEAIKRLRRFMIGGEPLPLDLGRLLAGTISGELWNLYGPTETTVWSAAQRIEPQEKQILIGRPVANTQMYVLNVESELAPIGSVGELYIGGEGLAREYLNRPDVTQERFVTHSFSTIGPVRLYRTGDLVRYVPDGRLEFMGRIDHQIKIRGVRIELGEIEVVLREHPDIRDAVVVVQEDQADDKRLVAYAIPSTPDSVAIPILQKWLAVKLPKALLPSAIVFLKEFPKTPNGKLDRRALPKPEQKNSPDGKVPVNELEHQITAIWSDVLGIQSVGVEERFFDLGGHSLLMIEVHDQLRDKLGHDVALIDLFRYPTVRSLADYLSQRSSIESEEPTGLSRGQLRQQSRARHSSLRKAVSTKRSS